MSQIGHFCPLYIFARHLIMCLECGSGNPNITICATVHVYTLIWR